MKDKEFAIGTYEINLLTDVEREYVIDKLGHVAKYIDTAINYNNDYCLSNVNSRIISKIASCHFDDYEFFVQNHLKCLKRDYVDIMLIHSNRGDWTDLAIKMQNDDRFKEIGVSNFNVDDLIKYKNLVGRFPTYNELEINPTYVDNDTVNFCVKNNIKIIAYGILGGKYNAMYNVAEYSLPYLVQFACNYADIVILRADSMKQTNDFVDVVTNYTEIRENEYCKVADSKCIVPMRYSSKKIVKRFAGERTYSICCGKNNMPLFNKKTKLSIDFPKFEMLGDYVTYMRYKYRQNYSDKVVYDYDFLIGDDGNYYVVYLFDELNQLSKINENARIEVYMLEV